MVWFGFVRNHASSLYCLLFFLFVFKKILKSLFVVDLRCLSPAILGSSLIDARHESVKDGLGEGVESCRQEESLRLTALLSADSHI